MNFDDSAAGVFHAAGRVYLVVGVAALLVRRHLRRNPPLRVLARDPVAPHQALDLRLSIAKDHYQFVEPFVPARFDHQGGVYYRDPIRRAGFGFREQTVLFFDDPRVDYLVQALAPLRVREDDRAKLGAVYRAVVGQHLAPVLADDVVVRRAPRLHDGVRYLVRVERRAA
jgi:hypothetical protein